MADTRLSHTISRNALDYFRLFFVAPDFFRLWKRSSVPLDLCDKSHIENVPKYPFKNFVAAFEHTIKAFRGISEARHSLKKNCDK